ncbi:hypothetical protein BN946_scf184775.g7 [Trametes cinnabarina]|uniref:Uncharacterized protein n=1 Tax=Pycnoporus cinnabarinus TaxID=5643 RepID=A0A060SS37_PYCCI|nr:hypothetical protein BN946_scf184775.g7 [Trametes cinnabarina]
MILLDGLDKHDDSDPQPSKLLAQSAPVTRVQTPTPSLPDYEASQAQLKPTPLSYPELKKKRSRRRRWKRFALYSLVVYFVLTVAIGVPLIVVKLRRRAYVKANPYNLWSADSYPLPPKTINLGDAPLRLSSAKSCNAWSSTDSPVGSLLRSELQYHVPVNGSVFVNTNITYSGNGTYLSHFSGQLLVGINDDPSASDAAVHVAMHHSTPALRYATHVCLMQTGQGGGIYLFTPFNLTRADSLSFNITLLLPQSQNKTTPRVIPQLTCHLPNFKQTYLQLDPSVTFGSVILGGAMSEVSIQSIQASQAVVKASLAEINGKFTVDSLLSLETVSAPINADIHLYNNGPADPPTYLHLTTGNSALNANITMYVPSGGSDDDDDDDDASYGTHFLAHAETFNAPLTLALMHDPASAPANVRLRALNNLGNTRVSVDSRYEGTFDVTTMFAQADVLTQREGQEQDYYSYQDENDGTRPVFYDSDDVDYGHADASAEMATRGKMRLYLPSVLTSTTAASVLTSAATSSASAAASQSASAVAGSGTNGSRCLEYDLISSSEIRGWVGVPPRPSPSTSVEGVEAYNSMGHLEIGSSLSGAQLVLLT